MPRKKADPEPDGDPAPKGESLPPMEDFVRRMSTRFSSDIVLPEVTPEDGEDDEDSEGEE